MSSLASLDDVNRILRYTTGDNAARDAELRASLAAVEDWARSHLRKIPDAGPQVEVYWDMPEDSTLYLTTDDSVVTKVNIFDTTSGVPVELELGHGYDVTDDGKLFLRPVFGVSPFEGAHGQRLHRTYARVEVHYVATGVVRKSVSEGIAYLAAGYWSDGPSVLRGIKSEKIGDYSYELEQVKEGEPVSYERRAMMFLGAYLHRSRVRVI